MAEASRRLQLVCVTHYVIDNLILCYTYWAASLLATQLKN